MIALHPDLRFALVPEWLLTSEVSDRALRLYCVLAVHCDYNTGASTPGRKTLAARMGEVSLDTVDRAKKELLAAGALSVSKRPHPAGDLTSNTYVIHRKCPCSAADMRPPGSPHESDDRGRTDAATKVNQTSLNQRSSSKKGRAPTQIAGRRVSAEEEQFALSVLSAFNEVSGRRFGSKEALGKIILRHREHPDLTVEDHRRVIGEQFGRPWWKGDASVSVVYGNGDVFDRALNGVKGPAEEGEERDDFSIYNRD